MVKITKDHICLVIHLLNKTGVPKYLWDECRDAGIAALDDAARYYDESMGLSFNTFAAHRVRGAFKDYLRWQGRTRISGSSINPVSYGSFPVKDQEESQGEEKVWAVPDRSEILLRLEEKISVENIMNLLKRCQIHDQEHAVVFAHIILDMTFGEIGEMFGYLAARSHQVFDSAIKKIHYALEADEKLFDTLMG